MSTPPQGGMGVGGVGGVGGGGSRCSFCHSIRATRENGSFFYLFFQKVGQANMLRFIGERRSKVRSVQFTSLSD